MIASANNPEVVSVPGEGEVAALDLIDPKDIGLINKAIRRGWLKSLSRMDRLIDDAERAAEKVEDPALYARLKDSHARTGATIAGVYTRAIQGPSKPGVSIGTMNVQNNYNEIEQMTDDELDANIAEQKRILGEG